MKEKSINPFPEVSTEGLKDQPHGPLISFSYNPCTKCGFIGNRGRFCAECGSSL